MIAHVNYRIRVPNVIYQTVDNEVVIVNLDNGAYHILQHSGVYIWMLLEQGIDCPGIIGNLQRRHPDDAEQISDAVQSLLVLLEQQALLERTEASAVVDVKLPDAESAPPQRFLPPHLESFEDLKDLLLLDPIHDVNEQGWPHGST